MTNDLPNTTYAVLGILSFDEKLSGYEIRKRAEDLRYIYWSPAQSQIYSELRRLAKLGFVSSTYVRQTGKPDKRLYQINESGKTAFRQWISRQPMEPTVVKNAVALRLYFGHAAEPQRLIELLTAYADETRAMLGQIAVVEEFLGEHEQTPYPALVAEWGRRYYESELATAQEMVTRLQNDL